MTYQDTSAAGLYERLHVESWSPEYGAPLEPAEEAAEAPPADPAVETAEWRPLDGGGGQVPPEVAFVDGVRRIEARLTFDHPTEGPVPGVMGAFGVGAAVWDRKAGRSSFAGLSVERMVVMAKGFRLEVKGVGGLPAAGESIPGDDPSDLLSTSSSGCGPPRGSWPPPWPGPAAWSSPTARSASRDPGSSSDTSRATGSCIWTPATGR